MIAISHKISRNF